MKTINIEFDVNEIVLYKNGRKYRVDHIEIHKYEGKIYLVYQCRDINEGSIFVRAREFELKKVNFKKDLRKEF